MIFCYASNTRSFKKEKVMKKILVVTMVASVFLMVILAITAINYNETKKYVDYVLDYRSGHLGQSVPTSSLGFQFMLKRIEDTYIPLRFYVEPEGLRNLMHESFRIAGDRASRNGQKHLSDYHRCLSAMILYIPIKSQSLADAQSLCYK